MIAWKRLRLAAVLGLTVGVLGGGAATADSAYRAFGDRGRPQDARRTITVVMRDNSFEPQTIRVRAGETVRFVVRNEGALLHEFNLGTREMHRRHQREMQTMFEHGMMTATSIGPVPAQGGSHAGGPHAGGHQVGHGQHMAQMHHNDPNSLLLEPGQSGELVWKFTRAVELEFACNIPGHYESGMVGWVAFVR
ncbi:cupredoxin domain-containing protein [Crenalkalicoccus roseus]|uniref:cupredoxin domain-containing protein n=1 Tax=Crenalkalicoccus roseus TaxID=1485588 RepID=UPI00108153CE|nr:cupredoxin domain-containing protein [Crenalkalicoccus roseus]